MMESSPLISLIIPCYNEGENLPKLIDRCEEVFNTKSVEVVLVDNGSSDNTQNFLKERICGHRFIRSVHVKENQGYGYGIKFGLNSARGKYIGWTHADLQADPADLLQIYHIIEDGCEDTFFKGKRYGRSIKDLVFTIGMAIFETLILRTPVWDINAQPNIFPASFYSQLESPDDFSLDLFFYYRAKKNKLEIIRFPVFFARRVAGEAHLNNLSAKLKYSKRTIQFSLGLVKSLNENKKKIFPLK